MLRVLSREPEETEVTFAVELMSSQSNAICVWHVLHTRKETRVIKASPEKGERSSTAFIHQQVTWHLPYRVIRYTSFLAIASIDSRIVTL